MFIWPCIDSPGAAVPSLCCRWSVHHDTPQQILAHMLQTSWHRCDPDRSVTPVLQGRTFDFGMAQARGAAIPAAVGSGVLCGLAPRTGASPGPCCVMSWHYVSCYLWGPRGVKGLVEDRIGLVLADYGSGLLVVVLGAITGCRGGLQVAAWLRGLCMLPVTCPCAL